MPEGISLLDLPQAAIGEIEGGNFAYMVTPDGQPYKVEISQLVAKMQADAGCGCVQTAKLFIPSAEVLQLNTTPKAFGLNVPAGYYVFVTGVQIAVTSSTTPYDTNTDIRIVGISMIGETYDDILSATNSLFNAIPNNDSPHYIINGPDVFVTVPNGNPLNGDSDITIYLTYMLIEL